jgi:hypothetical protein
MGKKQRRRYNKAPHEHFIGRDVKMPDVLCPQCGYHLDAASGMDNNSRPSKDDFAVCIGCATVCCFTDDFKLRIATADDFKTISPENRLSIFIAVHSILQIPPEMRKRDTRH